jgi:hypothetical protein
MKETLYAKGISFHICSIVFSMPFLSGLGPLCLPLIEEVKQLHYSSIKKRAHIFWTYMIDYAVLRRMPPWRTGKRTKGKQRKV